MTEKEANENLKSPDTVHFCSDRNDVKDACNAQWLMLYTFAAYSPEKPDPSTRELLRNFFTEFPDQCRSGPSANCYSNGVQHSPPQVNSRQELMLWLCTIENRCRKAAGMPTRLCRYKHMLQRWRYPDGYV